MVYSSGASKSRYSNSIVNQCQGGGNKKAGLPKHLRDSWTSIALHGRTNYGVNMTLPLSATTSISKPVGSTKGGVYFRVV